MPIVTRILCSVTQNAKHVRAVRMRSVQRNVVSKNDQNLNPYECRTMYRHDI